MAQLTKMLGNVALAQFAVLAALALWQWRRSRVRGAGWAALSFLLLGGTGTRPVGVILNRLPRNRGTDYYYYYASHGYGAGEGSYTGGYATRRSRKSKG